jgi:hypothetical protein
VAKAKVNALTVKAEVLAYLRYRRQFPIVAVEAFQADVLAVDERKFLWEVEVKVSLADLRADGRKMKHVGLKSMSEENPGYGLIPNFFSFAVPRDLSEKALAIIDASYPYAGLLSVHHKSTRRFLGNYTESLRSPKKMHVRELSEKQVEAVVKCLSGSLACAYARLVRKQETPTMPVEDTIAKPEAEAAKHGVPEEVPVRGEP